MNTLACCLFATLGAFSGRLPPSDYADTEVSTNVPFAVNANLTDMMSIALDFDATPSNSVEIAIGHDADGDGNLSPEESAVVFGYDCGTWFQRSAKRNAAPSRGTGADQPQEVPRRNLLRMEPRESHAPRMRHDGRRGVLPCRTPRNDHPREVETRSAV